MVTKGYQKGVYEWVTKGTRRSPCYGGENARAVRAVQPVLERHLTVAQAFQRRGIAGNKEPRPGAKGRLK
jgi:hypothetical protein